MKIYYFVHVTGTDPGMSGIPRLVKNLGRELVERDDFELVPVSWSKRLGAIVHSEQKLLDNLARHGGPALRESRRAREPIEPESGAWLLIPEAPHLGSSDPDYPSMLIDEPIGYARRNGLQVAVVFHDIMPLTHQLQRRAFVDMGLGEGASGDCELTRLRFTVYAHALALTDIVLPVSQTTGRLLFQWLVRHGHPAESLPAFSPILVPEEVLGMRRVLPHRSAKDNAGCKEFITVGTVCTHKNQLAAMAAFQRLTERSPELDIRFHVVGSMTSEAAVPASLLAKRSKGRIVLHGFLQDQEIEALAERAHASVFVSLAEGYGTPAAESLWRGKPCLCSNEGSIAEIAEGGGCLTVNPRRLEEIEAGFEALVTDTVLYDQLLLQISEREMKSWKAYADEVAQQLGAERIFSRPGCRQAPKPPLVSSGKPDGLPADDTAQTALFMLSASDLDVPNAYVSGRTHPSRRNGAICFDRATDGDVAENVLFFGPYVWLPPGQYEFTFDGEIEGELELSFTAEEGRQLIGSAKVTRFDEPVVVELQQGMEKFEIVGRRTDRLERLIFRNAFAEYRSLADAPPETHASAEVGLDSRLGGGETAVATAAAGSPPTAPETAADAAPAGSAPAAPESMWPPLLPIRPDGARNGGGHRSCRFGAGGARNGGGHRSCRFAADGARNGGGRRSCRSGAGGARNGGGHRSCRSGAGGARNGGGHRSCRFAANRARNASGARRRSSRHSRPSGGAAGGADCLDLSRQRRGDAAALRDRGAGDARSRRFRGRRAKPPAVRQGYRFRHRRSSRRQRVAPVLRPLSPSRARGL